MRRIILLLVVLVPLIAVAIPIALWAGLRQKAELTTRQSGADRFADLNTVLAESQLLDSRWVLYRTPEFAGPNQPAGSIRVVPADPSQVIEGAILDRFRNDLVRYKVRGEIGHEQLVFCLKTEDGRYTTAVLKRDETATPVE